MMKKHIPQRTCVGCRQVLAKQEMTRIVATADGVQVDLTGKKKWPWSLPAQPESLLAKRDQRCIVCCFTKTTNRRRPRTFD